ncbi:odorant receptor 49b-like [Anoplophora glabripennis]|uniref:odorant receptor 49b-like n=1 Tax=Anoplophora glabripennis TaxID=217634 RepID=UPI00087434FD|nr:odorant receptor 49b-like [Anoplophora glabripennis]
MLTGYSFFVLFSFNIKSAAKLFILLSDFNKFGKPPKFDERNEQLNRFSRYHYIYINLASFAFLSVTNIFKSHQCIKENQEYNFNEVCGLITNAWLPFDIDYFPLKQIYATLQVFSIFYVYVTAGTVTWLVVEVVEHISVRIDHIKHLFTSALKEKDPEEMKRNFRFAVQYHSWFLELEDELNKSFSIPMFSMMLLGAPILGCAAFGYMEVTGANSLLVICLSWFNALALVSFGGQRLINENLTIAEEIYNSKWVDVAPILGKDIIIILTRCQKPMKLRAAAFGVMNHAMIVSVSRAAYSYLNILRASSK